MDYNLQLDGCPVTSSTVKNLGVILDSNLSFENHISNVTKTAFFHLRNIAKLRNMLPVSDAEKLVHAFMTSRLDYCNALLCTNWLPNCSGGCPASSVNKLQVVQNAAARVLTRSRKYDHITPILQSLHWLPIKFCISYKILLLTYKALNGLAPAYLTSLLFCDNPSCSLRSQNFGLLVVPRIAKSTKGGRAFSFSFFCVRCHFFFLLFFLLSSFFSFFTHNTTQHPQYNKTKQQTHTQLLKVQSKGRESGKKR